MVTRSKKTGHAARLEELPPIVLYDGECGVCNRFVDTILKLESDELLVFAALDSEVGKTLQMSYAVPDDVDTVVLIKDGLALIHSDAALAVATHLRQPYRWVVVLRIVPRPIRDWAYRLFARNRHLFGGNATCRVVTPEERHRFLDLSSAVPEAGRNIA